MPLRSRLQSRFPLWQQRHHFVDLELPPIRRGFQLVFAPPLVDRLIRLLPRLADNAHNAGCPAAVRIKLRLDLEPHAEVDRDHSVVAPQSERLIVVDRVREPLGGGHRLERWTQEIKRLSRRAASAHGRFPGSATTFGAAGGCDVSSNPFRSTASAWPLMCAL